MAGNCALLAQPEDGAHSKSSHECTYRAELDMETLVCSRG